jgi:hypothetical protein
MVKYYAYLSMYDYVMYFWLCLVGSCWCNLVSIHNCITILSLDYTCFLRHPTFCKIVQKSSRILLSVNFVLV